MVFTKGNLSYLFTGKPSRWWQRSAVFVCRIFVPTIVFRVVDVLKNIFSSVVIFGLGRSVRLFSKKWSDFGSQGCFSGFRYEFFLLLPITFFLKYVSLEICNIQLHNCHIYSRKRIPSASCGQLSLFWLDVTFVMLLHPNESFSWRLIRCWYIQVFHVLVLRPSTSLTFALHLPLRRTHGTLQVITVRLNPLTGHNRQNHKNRPPRNPVGTQLRNIHVHTLRFHGFLWILFYIWAQLSRRETYMC